MIPRDSKPEVESSENKIADDAASESSPADGTDAGPDAPAKEIGGRDGPDPTRYGDWEKAGRCIDF